MITTDWRQFMSWAARLILGSDDAERESEKLGDITLLRHQSEAVRRIQQALDRFGGALLADDVGLGKTYVALAIASREKGDVIIAAPASLREMWKQASRRAHVSAQIISIESLSRRTGDVYQGHSQPGDHSRVTGLVIVDEAHNLRNPSTARYRALSGLTRNRRVLLLSATPIHNSEKDLHSLLALFLGARAKDLTAQDLGSVIVRRERQQLGSDAPLPQLRHVQLERLPEQDNILDAILALPPPLPPSDGGDGGALVTFTLVRLWSSSFAAFERGLRKRLAFGNAMLAALESGIHPGANELRSWCASDEVIQLPLFGLLASTAPGTAGDTRDVSRLSDVVRTHLIGLRRLLGLVAPIGPRSDDARFDLLKTIRERHRGEKIIAFSQFAETVRCYFKRSVTWGHTGMLTAAGGAIASGRITRDELISLFAPVSNGVAPPPEIRKVDFLFSTDVLSEGVNLQDASVLVHLDLAWTPVRLSQRVGRLVRAGSRAPVVTVYTFEPPASAESLLRMERRLAAKLSVARRSVGMTSGVLPLLHLPGPSIRSPAQLDAQMRDLLREYVVDDGRLTTSELVIAQLECEGSARAPECDGRARALALVERDGSCGFVLVADDGVTDNLTGIVSVLASLQQQTAHTVTSRSPQDVAPVDDIMSALRQWISSRHARASAGLNSASYARARRRLIRRMDAITSRTPRHLRPRVQQIAATARRVAINPYGSGAEHVLAELADARMSDEAWLQAVESFGRLQSRGGEAPDEEKITVRGILLLGTCTRGRVPRAT